MKQMGFDSMTKAADSSEEKVEPRVYSVSDINGGIRRILEANYPLIWVQGEISNFKAHSSGHHYFSLKDKKSQINAVMFRGFNSRLKFRPETGMEVLVRGKITVYEPRGNYQLFCELMEPVGAGAMQKAFEQLKAKLKSEGLFEAAKKKSLPAFPKHIAVVTSPTGAAIRDIVHVLQRRNRTAKVTVIPAMVQGEAAPASVIKGIELAQKIKDVDVIILGRGGGSMEDLWGFNHEGVARAIADCQIPVVSAVGHEVDFTIADFVADLRAPTPSAAAEVVVKNVDDLVEKLESRHNQLATAMEVLLHRWAQKVMSLEARLIDPKRRLQDLVLRCDELTTRLEQGALRNIQTFRGDLALLKQRLGHPADRISAKRQYVINLEQQLKNRAEKLLERKRYQLGRASSLLDSLSPLKVVDRGYSIVSHKGAVVKDARTVKEKETLDIRLAKGSLKAEVIERTFND